MKILALREVVLPSCTFLEFSHIAYCIIVDVLLEPKLDFECDRSTEVDTNGE